MLQTKNQIGKKNMSVCPITSVTTRLTNSVERAISCFREKMSSTTRTTTKQKNTSSYPPCAKYQRAANSHHNFQIVKMIWNEKLTPSHLLKPISLRQLTLSSVASLWKALVQRMTAKIFHHIIDNTFADTGTSTVAKDVSSQIFNMNMFVTIVHIIQQPVILIIRPYFARLIPVNTQGHSSD